MNYYTAGARFAAAVDKMTKYCRDNELTLTREEIEARCLIKEERIMRYGKMLEMRYKEICREMEPEKHKKTFMITIRPDETKTNFETFKHDIEEFLNRKMFTYIHAASFEQKGECEEDLGKGFHVHIVAATTCRSKGEVLRNTTSTFAKYVAPQCIQVDVCQNPDDVVKKYLTDYESQDGHKEKTKAWDAIWREKVGLIPAGPIKSDSGPAKGIVTPITVSFT